MKDKKTVSGKQWRKLDNAAKVFPATANSKNTKVFRFYCELYEAINPNSLQQALDITLEKYPLFKTVLRRGIFWFYLERNEYRPIVKEERKAPCSSLYTNDRTNYLFRVNYYKNRINFEVFHVLTDGTGATQFLRELVKNYLYVRYQGIGLEPIALQEVEPTYIDQVNDGFSKYYSNENGKRDKNKKRAHQIRGIKTEFDMLQVVEGIVDTKEMLEKAKEKGVSLTVYLTAIFLYAIYEEMNIRQQRKPVVIMVPVNLRNFFPSKSMMNFFGYIDPFYRFQPHQENTLQTVIEAVKEYFDKELTEEKMAARMNAYTRLEKHPILRLAPLEVKNRAIQAGFATTGWDLTAIFSNMGVVQMPQEYGAYIKQFGVFTSTHKVELCMCSFKERMVLNFTSQYDSTNIQRNFFAILKEEGVGVEVTENQFPEIPESDKKKLHFQQCLDFTSIVLIVFTIILDMLLLPDTVWSLFGIGAVASMWISVSTGFRKRRNLLKNSIWQLVILSIGAIIWDIVWGFHGWSIHYVIPGISMLVMSFMIIITKIQKLKAEEYMMYMVVNALFGLLAVPLLLMRVIVKPTCSVLSIGMSVLVLSFLYIFKKREFLIELHKNFHV
ncbi:MAG: DUF6320 domain-containing protein [Eubacteriales bacterium]